MKNSIYIDIDTENNPPIQFSKGPDFVIPTNQQEGIEMVSLDIGCLVDALITLIHIGTQNGYSNKPDLVQNVKDQLDIFLTLDVEENNDLP
jgi:hypothetical protein